MYVADIGPHSKIPKIPKLEEFSIFDAKKNLGVMSIFPSTSPYVEKNYASMIL